MLHSVHMKFLISSAVSIVQTLSSLLLESTKKKKRPETFQSDALNSGWVKSTLERSFVSLFMKYAGLLSGHGPEKTADNSVYTVNCQAVYKCKQ